MGAPNRYPDPDVPMRPTEVARTAARPPRVRLFVIAAIILGIIVLVGIAIFIARMGGGSPAPARPKPQQPAMWVASSLAVSS
jgi:hypothetical protein